MHDGERALYWRRDANSPNHVIYERLAPAPPMPDDAPRMWGATATMFAKGVLLGLGAAVPIGPVNVQIARQALRNGFGAGFALGCGAVTVDVFYAALTSVGVERLARSDV